MPRVNLVPQQEQQREFRRQFYIIPIAAAVLLVGAMAGSYIYYERELSNVQSDLDAVKASNAALAKDVAELQKYEELKGQKNARLSAVTADYALRYRWSRTLDDLMFVMPTDAWLFDLKGEVPGSLTITGSGTANSADSTEKQDLVLEGYTYEMSTVATLMVRVGLIPSLKDVVLIKADKEVIQEKILVHFWVGASLNQAGNAQNTTVAPVTGEQGPSGTQTTGTGTGTGTTSRTGTTGSTTPTGASGITGISP